MGKTIKSLGYLLILLTMSIDAGAAPVMTWGTTGGGSSGGSGSTGSGPVMGGSTGVISLTGGSTTGGSTTGSHGGTTGFVTGGLSSGGGFTSGGGSGGKLCAGIGADMSTCPGICPMGATCAGGVDPCPTGWTYFNGSYSPVTSGCWECATGNWMTAVGACSTPPPPTTSTTTTTTGGTTTGGSTTGGSTTSPPPVTCKTPEQDDGSGGCKFYSDRHRCDDGSVSGLGSPVSLEVGGLDRVTRFKNTVNKKLACCLNGFTAGDSYSKFDCIENSKDGYKDFDQLWASSDQNADGGQMNAIIFANSAGAPITGFYTLGNTRCAEYSEFAGELQPARVNAGVGGAVQSNKAGGNINADTVENVGSPIDLPSSSGYSDMKSRALGKGAKVPTTAAERRRCPILVRAAIVTSCPSNPVPPATPKTYNDPVISKRRCGTAGSVQVNIRVEQLTEITGTPKMQPIDTIIDAKNASAISIERIIANKYGNQCPPGSHRSGDACVDN